MLCTGEQLRAEAAANIDFSGSTRTGCCSSSEQGGIPKWHLSAQVHIQSVTSMQEIGQIQTAHPKSLLTTSNSDWLFVDCTCDGLATTPSVPIFQVCCKKNKKKQLPCSKASNFFFRRRSLFSSQCQLASR